MKYAAALLTRGIPSDAADMADPSAGPGIALSLLCLFIDEPKRKLDLMIVHALIEARSCERFRLLAKRLPEAVRDLYEQLERSEARHFELYLEFAQREHTRSLPNKIKEAPYELPESCLQVAAGKRRTRMPPFDLLDIEADFLDPILDIKIVKPVRLIERTNCSNQKGSCR